MYQRTNGQFHLIIVVDHGSHDSPPVGKTGGEDALHTR